MPFIQFYLNLTDRNALPWVRDEAIVNKEGVNVKRKSSLNSLARKGAWEYFRLDRLIILSFALRVCSMADGRLHVHKGQGISTQGAWMETKKNNFFSFLCGKKSSFWGHRGVAI
jgi:hypothetical protein